jgi:ABC-type multidrug transport system ATPase subunit
LQLLKDVGLGYLTLGQPSPTLSGGEAQRIKLVTELSKVRDEVGKRGQKAPHTLYVLDEPTVGLDPAQVIEIRKLIRELGRAHTVILSSHILSEVQAVCRQILILSKGHLAAAGSLEELTADGKSLEEVFLELTDGEPEEATGEEDAE